MFGTKRIAVIGLVVLLACGDPAAAAASPAIRYDVQLSRDGHADVQLCFAAARQRVEFSVDALRAVAVVEQVRRTSGQAIRAHGSHWTADAWRANECLRYTADLAALAGTRSEAGTRYGDALVCDPTYWLLRADLPQGVDAEVVVHEPEDALLSVPWLRVSRDGHTARYRIPDTPRSWSGSVVFGRIAEREIPLRGAAVRVAFLEGDARDEATTAAMLQEWIGAPARAIADVADGFPVPEVRVLVVPVQRLSLPFRFAAWLQPSAVIGGESARGQGNSLELVIDPQQPQREFLRDWTMYHELSHLMHPYLGDRGSWLAEGLATYYQAVLRARAGRITEQQAWQRMGEGFAEIDGAAPGGRLEDVAADMGKSHQFSYVYRSGAFYWLAIDVELRRQSGGARSLDSALAAFRGCCLPSYREWRPEEFVERLDRALGVDLFAPRFRTTREATRFPDWRALFESLGIERAGDDFVLVESAPDAPIRMAIMAPAGSRRGASTR